MSERVESAPPPIRDLLPLGALSTGLVFVGVTFEIPLLPELGSLTGLTVLGLLALEGFHHPTQEVPGPVATLLGAGGIIVVGFIFEVWPLVLVGSLAGLAVVDGLATLSVLA
ncbi:MAG: hypothetical protein ABEH88_03430 [Halobacteriales archaeon]